jgi:hypothetical protein
MNLSILGLFDSSAERAGEQKIFSAFEFLFENNQKFKKRNK